MFSAIRCTIGRGRGVLLLAVALAVCALSLLYCHPSTGTISSRRTVAATRYDLCATIAATRSDLRATVAATRCDLSTTITASRNDLCATITATRSDLCATITASRNDLCATITATRCDLCTTIATRCDYLLAIGSPGHTAAIVGLEHSRPGGMKATKFSTHCFAAVQTDGSGHRHVTWCRHNFINVLGHVFHHLDFLVDRLRLFVAGHYHFHFFGHLHLFVLDVWHFNLDFYSAFHGHRAGNYLSHPLIHCTTSCRHIPRLLSCTIMVGKHINGTFSITWGTCPSMPSINHNPLL
eukprot:Platyproteum_vivax@DN7042_c0_g1_i1.p2